jgi:cytochrome c-type biogenesis protein CcmH
MTKIQALTAEDADTLAQRGVPILDAEEKRTQDLSGKESGMLTLRPERSFHYLLLPFLRVLCVLRGERAGFLSLFVLFMGATPAQAGEAPPVAEDPVIEARVMKLAAELRCLVCQNQSLADSHAGLALDLKDQVREQMKAGKSDDEIRAYMVARYGDFVLYSPPVKPVTWLLWGGPFVLLLAGGAGLAFYMRSRRRKISRPDMSPEDQARARALLDGQSRKE